MAMRFHKSIKLGKGVSLNLGKKGASMSFGPKGLKTTVSTKGRVTSTVGIPGTGVSYTHHHKSASASSSTASANDDGAFREEQDNLSRPDLSTANFCIHCGKKRSKGDSFSKYGFCEKCNLKLRGIVKEKLTTVTDAIQLCDPEFPAQRNSDNPSARMSLILNALREIEALEKLRCSVPFFKSSTDGYVAELQKLKAYYQKLL